MTTDPNDLKLAPAGIGWSQVKEWQSLVFVSGQVAWDEEGKIQGSNVSEQAEMAFRNLQAVLSSVGSRIENVLKVTIYCTDARDVADIRAVRDKWLQSCSPASTFIVAAGLVDPGLLVEVEAIAHI